MAIYAEIYVVPWRWTQDRGITPCLAYRVRIHLNGRFWPIGEVAARLVEVRTLGDCVAKVDFRR
jgi:hypothetical protein